MPDSVLKKKSNSIAYNFVREGAARDEWRCRYIPTDENLSDLCTKPLAFGENQILSEVAPSYLWIWKALGKGSHKGTWWYLISLTVIELHIDQLLLNSYYIYFYIFHIAYVHDNVTVEMLTFMLCHVRGECFIYNWKFYIELVSYQNLYSKSILHT